MRDRLNWLFDVSGYATPLERSRARTIMIVSLLIIFLSSIYALVSRQEATGDNIWQQAARDSTVAFYVAFLLGVTAVSFILARAGQVVWAGRLLIVAWLVGFCLPIARNGLWTLSDGLILVILILLAGLQGTGRHLLAGMALALVVLLIGIGSRGTPPDLTAIPANLTLVYTLLGLTGVSGITYLFLSYASLSRAEGESEANLERLRLAEITSQVAQRISRRTALNEVLEAAVEQIRDEYPYIYHAQIFLIDRPSQSARLAASSGEVGRLLLARGHSLPIGSLSVIGQVTAANRPIVAYANSPDTIHRRNEFLPETAVEAAFPLRIGDNVIGALDLQSKTATAFREQDIPVFQSLADHLAIAIDNARLFEETAQRLQENQRLMAQMRQTMAEVERLNQQLTSQLWADYLRQRPAAPGLEVDFEARRTADGDWTPSLRQAAEGDHVVQQQANGVQVVAVPLRVRGQVVGAMEFELDANQSLTPDDIDLLQEVSERLGLAAETTRLFEESQRVAQREALVNAIATQLQASSSVEVTLNTAARTLKEALKVGRVAIRLGTPPVGQASEDGNV